MSKKNIEKCAAYSAAGAADSADSAGLRLKAKILRYGVKISMEGSK
jgi:hypothetical protein